MAPAETQNPWLARHYFDYVYIPAALLVFGTLIVKRDWALYSALVALSLGAYNIWNFRESDWGPRSRAIGSRATMQKSKRFSSPTSSRSSSSRRRPSYPTTSPCESPAPVSPSSALTCRARAPAASSYRFKLESPHSILGLPIGQHISIGAPLVQPDGSTKEIVRSYTPISGDHQPGYFDLLIKSYPQGNISKYMASIVVGQTIRIRGPKGAFVYTPNMVRHFGMIAGGTGITPMLQIIRAIVRGRPDGDKTQVDLIFANVTAQDILLKDDLDILVEQDSGIRVHYVLDNPPDGWTGGVGYVTADMITVWLTRPCPSPSVPGQ